MVAACNDCEGSGTVCGGKDWRLRVIMLCVGKSFGEQLCVLGFASTWYCGSVGRLGAPGVVSVCWHDRAGETAWERANDKAFVSDVLSCEEISNIRWGLRCKTPAGP
jgi:hypothetical protein